MARKAPSAIALVRVFAPLAFSQPLLLLQTPDNPERWYVVEQSGTIRTFLTGASQSTVFADLRNRILNGGERGLLGMAFHPDYPDMPVVYLSYTALDDGRSTISRFAVNLGGLTLDPTSELILLEVDQPYANHNGGQIAFGPDGFLYIGLGDGGSGGNPQNYAQNATNLLGALLRIDVDGDSPYAIPPDNPFAGNSDCGGGGLKSTPGGCATLGDSALTACPETCGLETWARMPGKR